MSTIIDFLMTSNNQFLSTAYSRHRHIGFVFSGHILFRQIERHWISFRF